MPEINLFGVKGKGEKIFIILDSSPRMMCEEMGGIQAYTIIKNEMLRIIESLPFTALFNVMVCDSGARMLFRSMTVASAVNTNEQRTG